MFDATLSIDLGASYTKVSYRSVCEPMQVGTFEREAEVLLFDKSPLIPSLAVRTRSSNQQWVFGRQAALMNPLGMQVFQNWKADLFRPRNDKDSATAAIIAQRFFEWLRSKIEMTGIDVKKCQTRVAMPAFENFDENAMLIARCMDLSGWDNPTLILKVREPHANTLGLFSRGRNCVSRTANGLFPQYRRMWGEDNVYIQTARGYTLFGSHGNLLTVMVLDIGAFTTDVAALTFDVTADADGIGPIWQDSHELGVINQLDRPLFSELGNRHGFAWSDLRFSDSEDAKRKLYRGETAPVLVRVDGKDTQLELGDREDSKLVQSATTTFAKGIWDKVQSFVNEAKPSDVFLTGGGSLIHPIADFLKDRFQEQSIRVSIVPPGDAAIESGDRCRWTNAGEGLQRLATAVGGASVVLQQAAVTDLVPASRPPIVTGLRTGYLDCRCQGGNKDCCFCGGQGFVFR